MSEFPISFHRAQYDGEPAMLFRCAWCERGLQDACFRANGARICANCAQRAQAFIPVDSRRIFWRSVGWGFAASVALGLALFVMGSLLLHWQLGWTVIVLSGLPAGLAMGKVMRWASGGAGGRPYQIVAVLLLYAAVAIAAGTLILGVGDMPAWAIPFLVIAPPVWLFVGRGPEAGLVFTMTVLGARIAWGLLPPCALRVTGPEPVLSAPAELL